MAAARPPPKWPSERLKSARSCSKTHRQKRREAPMKLLRFGEVGREKPGLLDKDGHVRDLSAHLKDITGDVLSADGLKRLAGLNAAELPRVPSGVRRGPPVAGCSKLIAIGLNCAGPGAEPSVQLPNAPSYC